MKHFNKQPRHSVTVVASAIGAARSLANEASIPEDGVKPRGAILGSSAATAPRILGGSRYLRLPELRQLVPWSAATIWRHSKNPASTFPKPIKLSERVTAWNREAVEAWLAEKEAA